MRVDTFKTALLACAASMALAACGGGGSSVESPGEGQFASGGTSGGSGGGALPPGTPAADCPAGFTNLGTAASGTLRSCGIPQQIRGVFTIPARAGTVYEINGFVEVGEDRGGDVNNPIAGRQAGVLNIEAGVRIAGDAAEYVVVQRGSQIFANGTASAPVVFTSIARVNGAAAASAQWGGIVINGRAPTSDCPSGATTSLASPNLSCEQFVEGLTGYRYGGNGQDDNSGTLRYVRVENPGFIVSAGNELNGVTFAGVGRGTTVEYLQVDRSADDAVEFFGGTVNSRYLVLTNYDDDGYDTDRGFQGAAQFVVVVAGEPTEGSRAFEMSSAGLAFGIRSYPKVANFTVVQNNATTTQDAGIILNTGTDAEFVNGVLVSTNNATACLDIDDADTITAAPRFFSVNLACSGTAGAFRADAAPGDLTATQTLFTAASANNAFTNVLYTPSLTSGIVNGANEAARPATDPTTLGLSNTGFRSANYVGAVRDATDTWYLGWTCGLAGGASC